MKNLLKISAFIISILAMAHVNAQTAAANWDGFYGQVGLLGYGVYMPKASSGTTIYNGSTIPTTFSADRINGPVGNVSLGYSHQINDTYLLGIGASIYPGSSKTATTNAATFLGTTHGIYHLSNIFSIYLTPGYAIDQDKLVYGKFGYTGASIHSSASGNLAGNFSEKSTNISGLVYGLGYKQIVWKSVYAFGEINYAVDKPKQVSITTNDNFTLNSTAKASGYDLIIGIGYRF